MAGTQGRLMIVGRQQGLTHATRGTVPPVLPKPSPSIQACCKTYPFRWRGDNANGDFESETSIFCVQMMHKRHTRPTRLRQDISGLRAAELFPLRRDETRYGREQVVS